MNATQVINAVQALYERKYINVATLEDAKRVAAAHLAIYLIEPDIHDNTSRNFGVALTIWN